MFYVLLVIPHLIALAGLLAYALSSPPLDVGEDGSGEPRGPAGGSEPPTGPTPRPPVDHPVLTDAAAPRRRMRDGERLSDLHPRGTRREHPDHEPSRLGAPETS